MRICKERKRMVVLAALLSLLAAAGIGFSQSYFIRHETVSNVLTVGDLEIGLREPEWEPENGEELCPGYAIYKNPTVKNVTPNMKKQPCYMQIRVYALDGQGQPIRDSERLELIRETIRYDASYNGNWENRGEAEGLVPGRIQGYSWDEARAFPMVNPAFQEKTTEEAGEWLFCYQGGEQGRLEIGQEATLFTHIVIPGEWDTAQMETLGDFQLNIRAEAIQAEGFSTAEEAFAVLNAEASKGDAHEEA